MAAASRYSRAGIVVLVTVLHFIAGHLEGAGRSYVLAGRCRVKYLDYDWSLNERKR